MTWRARAPRFGALVVVVVVVGCSAGRSLERAGSGPADATAVPFNADLRAAELRTLARTIAESYSHLAAKQAEWGIDLERLTARYEPTIREADTWKRYELAMVSYVGEFHDTHLSWRRARGPRESKRRIARLGLSTRFVGSSLLLSEVWPASAVEGAGLRVGDEVVAIDGRDVAQRLDEFCRLRAWSRLDAARHDFADDWPASHYDPAGPPAPRQLTIVRAGQRLSFRILPEVAPPPGRSRPPSLAVERRGEVTLLRLRSLQELIAPAQLEALAALLFPAGPGGHAAVPSLVIDLRDNGGGYEHQARALASRLTAHAVTGARLRVRLGPRVRSEHGAWRALAEDPAMPGWSTLQEVTAEPRAAHDFPANIAVVIDAGCRSSCETLALLLRALGARLFGETTGGASGAPIVFTMPWSRAQVSIPVWELFDLGGRPIEGVGVAPDEPIAETAADVTAGSDVVLARAVAWASTRLANRAPRSQRAGCQPSLDGSPIEPPSEEGHAALAVGRRGGIELDVHAPAHGLE